MPSSSSRSLSVTGPGSPSPTVQPPIALFTAPIGLVAGPVAGAILGELSHARPLGASIRAGLGTLIGLVVGAVAHVAVAATMIALFTWWVWRG